MVFRYIVGGRPDVVASKIDVLPAEWPQVSQKVIRNIFGLAQGRDGAVEIAGVPQDDGGDQKIDIGYALSCLLKLIELFYVITSNVPDKVIHNVNPQLHILMAETSNTVIAIADMLNVEALRKKGNTIRLKKLKAAMEGMIPVLVDAALELKTPVSTPRQAPSGRQSNANRRRHTPQQ
jgi:hypothetical protein